MKKHNISNIYGFIFLCFSIGLQAQQFYISGGNVTQSGGKLVLNGMNFVNNGSFYTFDGTCSMHGMTTTSISGTAAPLFDTLLIAKTGSDVKLEQDVMVATALYMQGGHIDLQQSDLQLLDPSSITGATANQYIKTTSTGTLIQPVADADVLFPVGNGTYNPVILNNDGGTVDNYAIRVSDEVLSYGSAGKPIPFYIVNRTWLITEGTFGGSNLDVTLLWSNANKLGFRNGDYVMAKYNSGWQAQVSGAGNSTLGLTSLTLDNTNSVGRFAIFEDRNGYAVPYVCADDDLLVSTTLSGQDDQHAATTLEATNVIESTADVIYTAGTSITLKPGFTAKAGSYFHAFLFSCTFSTIQAIESRAEIEALPKPEPTASLSVELFPNPFQESTTIKFFLPQADEVQLLVTDLNGKIIKEEHKHNISEGWQSTVFEPGNLPSGMYLLVLKSNNQTVVKKMVIERN